MLLPRRPHPFSFTFSHIGTGSRTLCNAHNACLDASSHWPEGNLDISTLLCSPSYTSNQSASLSAYIHHMVDACPDASSHRPAGNLDMSTLLCSRCYTSSPSASLSAYIHHTVDAGSFASSPRPAGSQTCPFSFCHDAFLRAQRPLLLLTNITHRALAQMLRLIGLQAIWTCPLCFVHDAILRAHCPLFLLAYIT